MKRTSLWEMKERINGTSMLVVASCRLMLAVSGARGGGESWGNSD